ncbi:MAG: glycolate oxidase iron-sulfur subunit [Solirubrobacteraceae bacterium]|nr:glycolate oxidase iron-sulfur subunit [Solirubrobacteraceae bacterium]
MTLDITPVSGTSPAERRGIFTPELLDRCISCGFCLPACPTYGLTRVETSSPRGRINLMRAIETGVLAEDDPTVVEESSFCLGCRACEPVCPAGVQYGALLEEWRDRVWTGRRRPLRLRALLWAVDRPGRVRLMGLLRRHARGGAAREGRANLMLGCFERAMYPAVSRSAQALEPGLAAPSSQGCCGALHAHNGELERGRELARELGEALPGTIVTTSGGCAAHLASVLGPDRVKELSQWLVEREGTAQPAGEPPQERGEARAVGGAPKETDDTTGPVAEPPREPGEVPRLATPAPRNGGRDVDHGASRRPRIGLQDSCHLRNGLGVWKEPRSLIEQVGDYVELPSAATCCGAAGTYAVLRPDDSARVLDRHLDEIAEADLDAIVVVNPGCYRQMQQGIRRRGLRTRVLHLAELLAGREDALAGAGERA